MEDLTKNQIVLLCILISFIVSIATGIMTTSLLMEAPVELTQTVNRVVERTIESVTPAPTITNPKPSTTQIQTVVISEDESVTKAVAKNTPAIVRIIGTTADGSVSSFFSLGVIVTPEGIIAADKQIISNAMTYIAVMSDGARIPLVPLATPGSRVTFFKAKPEKPYAFGIANLAGGDIQLGQTVVVIGGQNKNAIDVGRVTSLNTKDLPAVGTSTPVKYISSIETNIAPENGVAGAPIMSLSGDVVGLSLSEYVSSKTYFPSALIKKELAQIVVAR